MPEYNSDFKNRWFNDGYNYEYIYHFTSIGSLKKILDSNTFRLSNVEKMNDMNESIPVYERYKFFEEDYEKLKLVSQKEKEMRSRTFLGCFNILEDDENIRNKLSMWGYYAEGGRGVCLKINKRKLDEILFNEIYDIDREAVESTLFITKLKMKYKKSTEIEEMQRTYIDRQGDVISVFYATFEWLFGSKSDDWKHENEFRYLFFDWFGNDKSYFFIKGFNQCIDSIYIGERQNKDSINTLADIKDKLGQDISFYIRGKNLEEILL